MNDIVPVLITCDVDPGLMLTLGDKKEGLEKAMEMFEELKIGGTFLFVANYAAELKETINQLSQKGHEIGCHGLTHGGEEEYDKLAGHTQKEYLFKATKILEDLVQKPVTTFRGPRVRTSHVTQKILVELGYKADCSVCSQRLDLISSNLINLGWIFAPRTPYHPNKQSAYRRGDNQIWVIPISALIIPFISSCLYVFGLRFMKAFFRLLYAEARINGKPIVYLFHPYEFSRYTLKDRGEFSNRNVRVHGFQFRRLLKERKDEIQRMKLNRELFRYFRSFPGTQFMTVSEYLLGFCMSRTPRSF